MASPPGPDSGAAHFCALLAVRRRELADVIVPLLKRAHFDLDVVTTLEGEEGLAACRAVHRVHRMEQVAACLEQFLLHNGYDLIVLGDDELLLHVLQSPLSREMKQQILPIVSLDDPGHLYSKIGLSRQLAAAGILTPRFEVATSAEALASAAARLGYPLLVKLDRSGGGAGIFRCNTPADLVAGLPQYRFPLLVQEVVEGKVIDLSGFFRGGLPVHVSYSTFERTVGGPYGPSSVRRYHQLGTLDPEVLAELKVLGRALGADGFASVTAIGAARDGKRYYIEADMRPNLWVDHGRHIGNDAAPAIAAHFAQGETMHHLQPVNAHLPESVLIPLVGRLSLRELLFNSHGCWHHAGPPSALLVLILRRMNDRASRAAVSLVKPWLPGWAWQALRRGRRANAGWFARAVRAARTRARR